MRIILKSKLATYLWRRTLSPQALNLAIPVNLVVLEDSQLGLLALVLDLLGSGVHLLLALLATTTEAEDEVQRRFLLDVVVGQGSAILELLASEDQTLLIGGDAFLVCRGFCQFRGSNFKQRLIVKNVP